MTSTTSDEASPDDSSKISAAFAARLAELEPNEQIRAIVLPAIKPEAESGGTAARSARREAAAASIAAQTGDAFAAIDGQLEESGGRRLTRMPNRLGFILVEATVAAIRNLARLECVKAIIEDQPLHPINPVAGSDRPN
ncbi:MAG: hypothetical protein QM346_16530 [Chloroflexota bacterium]|jgi:hypothetical protein|nr:hypothetical protein [Chloroflexota bacterium]